MPNLIDTAGNIPSNIRAADIREGVITHSAPPENIVINKFQLLLVLERMQRERPRKLEWCFLPAGIFVGVMLALLTADFKDSLGVDKATWHALALLTAAVTAIATVVLFCLWAYSAIVHPRPTANQIFEGIIREMAKTWAQVEDVQLREYARAGEEYQKERMALARAEQEYLARRERERL